MMKIVMRWILWAAALLLPGLAKAADDPFLGTWRLNHAKSIVPPDYDVKTKQFLFAPDGEGVTMTETVTSVSPNGENATYHLPYVNGGRFTPQNASPLYDQMSVVLTDPRTMLWTLRLNGKDIAQARVALSADRREMTMHYLWNVADPTGKIASYRYVYDRQ